MDGHQHVRDTAVTCQRHLRDKGLEVKRTERLTAINLDMRLSAAALGDSPGTEEDEASVDGEFQTRWSRVFLMLFAFNLLAAGTLLRVAAWEIRRVRGLDADTAGDADRALGLYEEALRVDATNPYAYLAIARHHASGDDPGWALSFIDKADSLFRAEGGPSPRVQPHLVGLRGQALYASGEVDAGLPLLEQAWSVAPDVWTDGQLSADELR